MPEQVRENEPVEPRVDRPYMPAGYGVPASSEGLLPWSHADERLRQARNYWVVTASPAGRPHAIPIWGAWIDGAVYFEGGSDTRWGRNLDANNEVVVHLESGDDVVILEGHAEPVAAVEPSLAERLVEAYGSKYNYTADPANWSGGGLYAVRPRKVLAWNKFPTNATRFRFDPQ